MQHTVKPSNYNFSIHIPTHLWRLVARTPLSNELYYIYYMNNSHKSTKNCITNVQTDTSVCMSVFQFVT